MQKLLIQKLTIMKNLFKPFISLFLRKTTSTLENELKKAVWADDVRKAYHLLSKGVNPNFPTYYWEEEFDGDRIPYKRKHTTSLLSSAQSEPMRQLLRHFNALPYPEIEKLWKEEAERRERIRLQLENEEHLAKQQKLKEKAVADNHFLDTVLKD